MANRLASLGLSGILALTSVSGINCVEPSSLIQTEKEAMENCRDRDLIVGFEGLGGGYLVHNLVARVASDLSMAGIASCGNYGRFMEYAREAHRNNRKVYILGFSSGANEARLLAEECEKEGIAVERLFLPDPTFTSRPFHGKIPKNVREVVDFRSDADACVVGGEVKEEDCGSYIPVEHNYIGGGHLDLPRNEKVVRIIESEIMEK